MKDIELQIKKALWYRIQDKFDNHSQLSILSFVSLKETLMQIRITPGRINPRFI